MSLATQVGREMGVPMRLANLTLEEMTEALARGWEGRDSRSSMILQKERSGKTLQHLQRLLAFGRREGAVEVGQDFRRELHVDGA